jgi:hypothetical protein
VHKPASPPITKPKTRWLKLSIAILVSLLVVGGIGVFLAGFSYYQMRISAQATYDAEIQATAIEAVNATHTARAILRSQATQAP